MKYDPLELTRFAWIGCKVTNAAALWLALILKMPLLILIPLLTHGISALFGPRNAPLLVLYGKIGKKKTVVDSHALRFAHTISSVFSALALILIYTIGAYGWIIVFFLAIATTLGAFGFCTATKLYGCVNGKCCMK